MYTESALKSVISYCLLPFSLLKMIFFRKDRDKPLASFLSTSSTSAAWPEQISPLEPSKDSIGRETSGFDALGVRPKEPPAATGVTDAGSGDSSGRSTPVYHHYHHHFHHTQPQGRVPGTDSLSESSSISQIEENTKLIPYQMINLSLRMGE